MKKYLASFLAFVLALSCVACGGNAENNQSNENVESAESGENIENGESEKSKVVLVDVESLEFSVAEEDAEPEGFICVVDRGDKYYWQIGVDDYEDLYEMFELTADQTTYVNVFVAATNEEKYPYLYPEAGWSAYVTSDTLCSWFNEDYQEGVLAAFNEWRSEVYSKFDFETIRTATYKGYIENAPDGTYEATQEDIDMFMAYASNTIDRNAVYAVCAQELGRSVGGNAYEYLKAKVADKLRNAADVGTLLKNMGITNTGGTQENFGGGVIATYFDFDSEAWAAMGESIAIVEQFLEKGMTFSNASDNMNRLHSYNEGRILYEASNNDVSTNNAFAIVVAQNGELYWRAGIDNCEAIRTVYELSSNDTLDLQVQPIIDESKAEYSLPDGLNPEVTRYFIYFEDEAVTWTLTTRNGEEFPDWFTADMQNEVMAAFDQWKEEVYSHLDLNTALNLFPIEVKDFDSYTEEDVQLLKEYVTVLRDLEAQGLTMGDVLREAVTSACGSTLWSEMNDWTGAKWRIVHTDCPMPCMKIGYCAYHGLVSFDGVNDKLDDSFVTAVTGYPFTDIDWGYGDGGYPFQAAVDLMNRGLIVYSDYENWYLTAGEDCTVLLEISEADLMAK